jgi:hypothetical protein
MYIYIYVCIYIYTYTSIHTRMRIAREDCQTASRGSCKGPCANIYIKARWIFFKPKPKRRIKQHAKKGFFFKFSLLAASISKAPVRFPFQPCQAKSSARALISSMPNRKSHFPSINLKLETYTFKSHSSVLSPIK